LAQDRRDERVCCTRRSVTPRRTTFARTDSRGRTEPLAANLSLLAVIVVTAAFPQIATWLPAVGTVIAK